MVHVLHTHQPSRRLAYPRSLRRVYACRKHQHSTVLIIHKFQAIPRMEIKCFQMSFRMVVWFLQVSVNVDILPLPHNTVLNTLGYS
jgi:hypothetical protein